MSDLAHTGLSVATIATIRGILARFPEVESAVLYGSRAKGTFKPGSDIDLTLNGEGITQESLVRLHGAFDDSSLPYTFDLSRFDSLENAKLREHIERVGIVFYERDSSALSASSREKNLAWATKPFESCIESVKYPDKIQRRDFLDDGRFPIISQEAEFINGYWDNPADVFKLSTPVVVFGDHTQVLKYVDFDFVLGADGVKILQPREFLWPKFFFYQLQAADFTSLGYARHYRLLKELEIKYPPLDEQRRIVEVLDEAFACIAAAKAAAEKNLQNARALFDSHLDAVFSQRDPDWVETTLESITTKIGSGATPRGGEESYKAEGISLIRSLNVHDLGFKYAKLAFLDEKQADELSNVEVKPRDVLLNITGASVARCTIVPADVLPARVNQHVAIIRPIADKLDADFLHYLLISKRYKDQLLKTGEEGGSTRQAITKAQIQAFIIEYPNTIEAQKTIVGELTAMLSETARLASIYQRKLDALEALKKSLLNRAFDGEL